MRRAAAWAMLFAAGRLWAADGNTSAEFLKLPAGARAAALGDTQAAIANDAFAVFTNPAALGDLRTGVVSLSHHKLFEDVEENRLAFAWPTRSGTWAGAYQRLSLGDYLAFDAQGTPTGTLSSEASAITLSWGKNLVPDTEFGGGLFLGVGAKSLEEKHAGVSASGFAADLGFMARPWGAPAARSPWLRRMSAGLAVRNLGQGLQFDRQTAPLPTEYVFGFGYTQAHGGDIWTAGLDFHQMTGEGFEPSVGLEYWLKGIFALRAGYHGNDVQNSGMRAGAGFRLAKLQVDYAWSAQGGDLESVHRFSLTYRFGLTPVSSGASADLFLEYVEQGKQHMDMKLFDRAILDFNEALRIRPDDEEVQSLLLECGKAMDVTQP